MSNAFGRIALALDHAQTDCLCAYGALALRLNRTEEALECLRAAARLAPDDPKVLAQRWHRALRHRVFQHFVGKRVLGKLR